ncbi:MAG: D-aminoacylase [Promethearchaeota archaeon]|nr:MAG: D-aminoacylase [Candidatus Lokiarchaeota archaeon]
MGLDIIIKNGKIIDGTGNPWYIGDIGIGDEIIQVIKRDLREDADKIIDASDLIVCPGFIDMHSHTDYGLLLGHQFTRVASFIRQGITTCVIGMCGDGAAPIPKGKEKEALNHILKMAGLGSMNIELPWHAYKEYLKALEKNKCAINLIPVVGYNNIRIAGGAAYENRVPTNEELRKMKGYLREALEAGAFGMSTGLIYAPQIYAKTEELIELAKVLADYNALYFSHIRGEGRNVIDAVKEAIEIVRESGCDGGQIAHHKIAGKIYWGKSKETLKLIEEANEEGISIACDQYPYNRGMLNLSATLPPWIREGTEEQLKNKLRDPDIKKRIKNDIINDSYNWENIIYNDGFDRIFIVSAPTEKWKDVIGRNISEITRIKGYKDDWETYFKLLLDDPNVTSAVQGEEDIRRIMTSRYQMFGTDGAGIPNLPALGAYHPRFYGTYPRILGKYVREEKVLTLEDAIRRMTSFPSQKLRLKNRGLVRESMCADIVIFNPETVIDKATYENPHQFPEGIHHVIVNGIIVVENNEQNRKRPGRILRRPD